MSSLVGLFICLVSLSLSLSCLSSSFLACFPPSARSRRNGTVASPARRGQARPRTLRARLPPPPTTLARTRSAGGQQQARRRGKSKARLTPLSPSSAGAGMGIRRGGRALRFWPGGKRKRGVGTAAPRSATTETTTTRTTRGVWSPAVLPPGRAGTPSHGTPRWDPGGGVTRRRAATKKLRRRCPPPAAVRTAPLAASTPSSR